MTGYLLLHNVERAEKIQRYLRCRSSRPMPSKLIYTGMRAANAFSVSKEVGVIESLTPTPLLSAESVAHLRNQNKK